MPVNMNDAQKQAVAHKEGPCMVLAGPGSGKTFVITNRIKYLIEKYGVDASNILVITFTKAAAGEMKQRFYRMMQSKNMHVSFGTFHAIFFHILKYAYHYSASDIIKEEERVLFLKNRIHRMNLEIENETDFAHEILSEISRIKNNMIDIENYYSTTCEEETFRDIYRAYHDFLTRKRKLDFDDMLVLCYELLHAREDILQVWQKKFQYILIDEYQDINRIQYEIIKLLALPQNNLFIVGDDDQSIYRFRGAMPSIMLNFEKDYPDAVRILLDVNYRCTQEITDASLRLVSHNKQRFDKKISSFCKDIIPLEIKEFKLVSEENRQILEDIKDYIQKGYSYNQIAILFRTNTQPRMLISLFMEYQIPFRMKDSLSNIFEHWISKNIFSYIRIAKGGRQRSDFFQIMNKPNRYFSREAFASATIDLNDVKDYYQDRKWMVERVEQLEYDLAMLSKMTPYAALQYIRKGIEYDTYLIEYAKERKIPENELLDLIEEVQESARAFQTFEEWYCYIEKYGQELYEHNLLRENMKDAVTMSTMHASKGLEYEIVFIMNANEGITPHHKSILEEDIEEERRMFYVAMTRAKRFLHIYLSKERYNKELICSRFVEEIRKEKMNENHKKRLENNKTG